MARHRADGVRPGGHRRGLQHPGRVGRHTQRRDRAARGRDHPGDPAVRRRHRRARWVARPGPALGDAPAVHRDAPRHRGVRRVGAVAAARPVLGGRADHRLRGGAHRLRARGIDAARQATSRTDPRPAQRRGRIQRRHHLADLHLRPGPGRGSDARRDADAGARRGRAAGGQGHSGGSGPRRRDCAGEQCRRTTRPDDRAVQAAHPGRRPAAGLHDEHRGARQRLRLGVRLRHRPTSDCGGRRRCAATSNCSTTSVFC